MHFLVSHVEEPMDISLKRVTNPFNPLMSLYMIYYMSNNNMYYHLITNDVELCQNIKLLILRAMVVSGIG